MSKSEQHLREGNAHWFAGDPERALAAYKKAVAALATDAAPSQQVDVKSAYALCLCELGNFDAAFIFYPEIHRLCLDHGLIETTILRQWAKALEQTGDFRGARQKYETITPNSETAPMDCLHWNHALGLLNWREGRLTEARKNLNAAVDFMPEDKNAAAGVIGVLGNDALLSLELGDQSRAMRLADQMFEIRKAADGLTLSGEINVIRVQAALAKGRGDFARQVDILRDGVELIEARAPDDWMRRLDLASDYVAASIHSVPSSNTIEYLATLCQAAPDEVAWIGRFMLARLQVRAGEADAAKINLAFVISTIVGIGSAESEVEIIAELAGMCVQAGNASAAIFLGKLMLKYLTQIVHTAERAERHQILATGDQIIEQTTRALESKGRFEEALALTRLRDRVERFVLVLCNAPDEGLHHDPVPLDQTERQAEAIWLNQRNKLVKTRAEGDHSSAMEVAFEMIDALTRFQNTSGLAQKPAELTPPNGQHLRISLVPSGDHCVVHYLWSDSSKTKRLEISARAFFKLVADLGNTVHDLEAWQRPAAQLYQHLIAPIKSALPSITCLEIDASGILGRIPFGLLSDGSHCLIQQVPIKYVINTAERSPSGPPRQGLVHFAGSQSGPLVIHPNFLNTPTGTPHSVTVVAGEAFTRQGFLDGLRTRPAYISIATHLDTEPTRPDHWALWLGSDEPLYLSDFGAEDFDFNGVSVAVLATCSSGLEDATHGKQTSLAALVLEKGAHSLVGTLWEISETAAAHFVEAFWGTLLADQQQDPATVLATLQAHYAKGIHQTGVALTATGGIGERLSRIPPSDWAAFAVFENCNHSQHRDNASGTRPVKEGPHQ